METYLIYIGKVALSAGAFYLAFLALFQNQKQFAFNRIYLPVSFFLSFMIPLITFTTVQYVDPLPVQSNPVPVFTESFEPAVSLQPHPEVMWVWYHWLFAIYTAGIVFFLVRLLIGYIYALHIIRESRVRELFSSRVNISERDIHPFSFFNRIVLSEDTLSHPHLEMIVEHERIHVKERHTFDILFTEILFLFQWFNPFAWLLKDAVKNNLEYKTDHEIVKTNNVKTYQFAMLALADKQGVAPFLTALNGSQLRNRILMMGKKNKNKYALLKQLVVLPLLAVLVTGLAGREVRTEIIRQDTTIQVQDKLPAADNDDISKLLIIIDGEFIPSDNLELKHIKLTDENPLNTKYLIEIIEALNISMDDITSYKTSLDPSNPYLYIRTKNYIPGTNKAFEENTTRNIILDEDKLKEEYYYAIDNKIVTKAEFEKQGKNGFKDIVFLTGKEAVDKYGKEYNTVIADAVSGVPNFIIKDQVDDWSGENQNVIFPKERTGDPRTTEFHRFISQIHVNGLIVLDPSVQNFPYVTLDDKLVTDKIIIDENDVEPLMIYQPPWSEKFGEEYINGIIHIKTKKEVKLRTIIGKVTNEKGQPIEGASVVIEGRQLGVVTNRDGNYRIEVEPDDKVLIYGFLYHPKKKIAIDGKEKIDVVIPTNLEPSTSGYFMSSSFRMRNSRNEMVKPIYLLNDKEVDIKEVDRLFVKSHKMLPDSTAVRLYGEKGKNGIVDITLFQLSDLKIVIDGKIIPSNTPELKSLRHTPESRNNGKYIIDILDALDINFSDVEFSKGTLRMNNPELYIRTKNYKPGTNPEFEKMTEMPVARIETKVKKEEGEPVIAGKITEHQQGSSSSYEQKADLKAKINEDLSAADILIVVDGSEYEGELSDFDVNDFESVTILKDKSATALYGKKGENGVILIKTKSGNKSNMSSDTGKIIAGISEHEEPVYYEVEEMPEFPGGELALRKFIAINLRYPVRAQESGIQGKVYVSFIIDKEGKVSDAQIKRGVHELLDQEALRVVNMLPAWKPGKHRGKEVNVFFTLPVAFGLQ